MTPTFKLSVAGLGITPVLVSTREIIGARQRRDGRSSSEVNKVLNVPSLHFDLPLWRRGTAETESG
jgi:hypothetical protein